MTFHMKNMYKKNVPEVPNVQMNEIKKYWTFYAGFLQNLASI